MKSVWTPWLRHKTRHLGLALMLSFGVVTGAQALNLGGIGDALSNANQTVQSITSGISAGMSIIGDLSSLFGGGTTSSSVASSGVPNVPNGDILPGPGNAAYGMSYVRDVFLPNLTNWVVALVLAGSVVVVLGGGMMYIFGGQDQEMVNKGRDAITWAILGMIVTICAYAIVRIVITINFLG